MPCHESRRRHWSDRPCQALEANKQSQGATVDVGLRRRRQGSLTTHRCVQKYARLKQTGCQPFELKTARKEEEKGEDETTRRETKLNCVKRKRLAAACHVPGGPYHVYAKHSNPLQWRRPIRNITMEFRRASGTSSRRVQAMPFQLLKKELEHNSNLID